MTPQVSVVMSVYNGEQYLKEAVESILTQTFTDFEFIIINDGSTDKTRKILEAYHDERMVLVHQENIGLTKSLNKGIALAKGQYIARQDADDVSLPKRFEKQIEFFKSHPEVAVLGSAVSIIGPADQPLGVIKHPSEHDAIITALRNHNCFCHGSTMFLKRAFDKVGRYSEFFTATQDYDLWLRIADKFFLANLQTPLYQYRFNPDAITFRRIVTQKKLADLARKLAAARTAGAEESEIIKEFTLTEKQLTQNEKMEIFLSYLGWVKLLYSNSLLEEAHKLAGRIIQYHPYLLIRFDYGIVRLFNKQSALKRLLEMNA